MQNDLSRITILALRPGRREIGLAVLENDELIEWGILSFRQRTRLALLDQIERRLTEYILRHQPTMLAFEQPSPLRFQTSPMLKAIVHRIEQIIAATDISLRTYLPKIIKQNLGNSRTKTYRQLADQIAAQYPHLKQYRMRTSEWKKSYWLPMFYAIAVAQMCAKEQASLAVPPHSIEREAYSLR